MKGSQFVRFGDTHGALDDINSTGMIVSNFAPTHDTSTSRVAALYDGFKGLREYRARENGAEWLCPQSQVLAAIDRSPVDAGCRTLPNDGVFLRIWSPIFDGLGSDAPVEVTIKRTPRFSGAQVRRTDPPPNGASGQRVTLTRPLEFSAGSACERVYALPSNLVLAPEEEYRIAGGKVTWRKRFHIP